MNVNMKMEKKDLNDIFGALLKNALENNVTLNFNIELIESEIKVNPVQPKNILVPKEEVVKVIEEDECSPRVLEHRDTVTLTRCFTCGAVQVANVNHPYCHVCGDELPSNLRHLDYDCISCKEPVIVDILGDEVDYVSCPKCKKKHTIRLNKDTDKWEIVKK